MKVVVINLDKSVERMDKMKKQLQKLKINYARFSAINGRELKNIDEKTTTSCNKFLCNKSMVGCALSHLEILKTFLISKDNFICVMEDDVDISDQLPDFLNKTPEIHEKLNFDIISLFCIGMCSGLSAVEIGGYTITKPLVPFSLTCYIVSRHGAEKILRLIGDKVQYHLDFSIAMKTIFTDLNYYTVTSPHIINLTSQPSTMGLNGKSIAISLFELMKMDFFSWFLNMPVFCFNMKYSISSYMLILITALIIGIKTKYNLLVIFALVEIILLTMF